MSFVTYGGAINGHILQRKYGPPTGPLAPNSMLVWVGNYVAEPRRGPTLNSGVWGGVGVSEPAGEDETTFHVRNGLITAPP